MGYSKHELSVVNMLHSLKNIITLHPYLAITATALQNGHFPSVPKVAVVERFNCIYYIDTSVLLENIPLVKFIKTTSGT